MTNRQPHQDMFLAAADAARMRQILIACSGVLAGDVNLAIDTIDFSSPARRAR